MDQDNQDFSGLIQDAVNQMFHSTCDQLRRTDLGDIEKKLLEQQSDLCSKFLRATQYKLPPTMPEISDADEKEVLAQAFDKTNRLFHLRSWIMEGRGNYTDNDDRYKEEVRYLYDEFQQLYKDTWGKIKSKSFEYRHKIISQHYAEMETERTFTWKEVQFMLSKFICEYAPQHSQIESPGMYINNHFNGKK